MGTYLRRHTFFPGEESMQRRRIGRGDFDFPSPYVPSPLKRPKEGLAAPPLDFTPERRLRSLRLRLTQQKSGVPIGVPSFCLRAIKRYLRVFGAFRCLELKYRRESGRSNKNIQQKLCFAEQSCRFSSLFSLLFSLEKVAVDNGEKGEERREKSEKYKKKKPLTRLFLFGARGGT